MSSETVPGGRYLRSDGVTFQDANGNVIAPEAQPVAPASDLPEDYPGRKALIDAGLITLAQVNTATDEALLAIKGIADATLKAMREYRG